MSKHCTGLVSVQCCNFDIKNCEYRSDDCDCYNPEVVKTALEQQLARYTKPKRKPDANGVLPLTEEELKEFSEVVGEQGVYKVYVGENGVAYYRYKKGCTKYNGNAVKIKEVAWILSKFNLTEG